MLGIPEVIVPPHPGITSAVGLLISDLRYDAIRTSFQVSGAVDLARINADFAAMEKELAAQLHRRRHRPGEGDVRAPRRPALCRPGLRAASAVPRRARSTRRRWPRRSRPSTRCHRREYGHHFARAPIEIVNLRAGRRRRSAARSPSRAAGRRQSLDAARVRKRHRARSASAGKLADYPTDFYRRDLLPVGERFAGPAIILQMDSTTVVPPGTRSRPTPPATSSSPWRDSMSTAPLRRPPPSPTASTRSPPRVIQGALENIADRDGLQAHAHELLLDHPRSRRISARRWSMPRAAAWPNRRSRRRCSPARSPATSAAS